MNAAGSQTRKRSGWKAWRYLVLRRATQASVLLLFLLATV